MRVPLLAFALLATGCVAPGASREAEALAFEATVVDADVDASEPMLALDAGGRVFVSAMPGNKPDAPVGMPCVSGLWRSEDEGATWTRLAPHPPVANGMGAGGGDSALSLAPDGTILVSDLWVGSTTVAVSRDHGESWTSAPVAGESALHDRQWNAADHAGRLYVFNRMLAPTAAEWVTRSDDGGRSWRTVGSVWRATDDAARGTVAGNVITHPTTGALHTLYTCGSALCVGTSTDAGATWSRAVVADDVPRPVIFPVLAADDAGALHAAWSDGAAVRLASSPDGAAWSDATVVSEAHASAIFPWIAAGAPGRVALAWYETDARGAPDDEAAMRGAAWRARVAITTDGGATWMRADAHPAAVHRGAVNTKGLSPEAAEDWSLGDMLGVATGPDGRVHVAYTVGSLGEPPRVWHARQVAGPTLR